MMETESRYIVGRLSYEAHNETPYATALTSHAARQPDMFMVPGHAGTSSGMSKELSDFAGTRAVNMDIPQLIEGIDVGAHSPFARAEALAAEAWGAERVWFLANGSSQGNRIAVIATAGLSAGGCLIAQRSAHSSLSDGLIIAGIKARFVQPSVDVNRGINHGITPALLQQEFNDAKDRGETVTAVQVISPSYFGAVADIKGLAEVAHHNGAALLVDAAWAAHFGFHPQLPEFPTTLGADLVVTSVHKMGGGLGQSALVLLGEGPFTSQLEPLIDRAFRITQTTSASSLLLGSLDIARRSLVFGERMISSSMSIAEELRSWVRRHESFEVISDGFSEFPDIIDHDPLRVSIDVTRTGMTGYEVRSKLAANDIYLEIATTSAVVAFFGPGKSLAVNKLTDLLAGIAQAAQGYRFSPAEDLPPLPAPGPTLMSPRDAYFSQTEIVSPEAALGRVSADALAAYPPGIPNVLPGEEITAEVVAFLQAVARSPIGYIRGAHDPDVNRFRVVTRTNRTESVRNRTGVTS